MTIRSVAIVGYGRFGRAVAGLLDDAQVRWRALDPHVQVPDGHRAGSLAELVQGAQAVILATPIHTFASGIGALLPVLRGSSTIVVDVGSVKVRPEQLLRETLGRDVAWVATHPLFGPVSLQRGERPLRAVVCVNDMHPLAVDRVQELFTAIGCEVVRMSADAHDRTMASTHALAFFIAKGLLALGEQPDATFAPASYQAIARAVAAVRADAGHLFATIQHDNPHSAIARRRLLDALQGIDEQLALRGAEPMAEMDALAIPGPAAPAELLQTRELIDELDAELLSLLARRTALSRRARASKSAHGRAVKDPQRERELLDERARAAAAAGLDPAAVRDIFAAVLRQSRGAQRANTATSGHGAARIDSPKTT